MHAAADPHPDDLVSPADMVFMALGGAPPVAQRVAAVPRAVQPMPDPVGSLSGRVFHDADGDGRFAEGDTGVPDVTVVLIGKTVRGQPVRGATKTKADGQFAFEGLPPGTYTVARDGGPPLGRACVGTVNGQPVGEVGEDGIGRIGVPPGGMAEGYSFAEVRAAAVSGLVLVEENDDDGPGESPAEGIVVMLTGVDGRGRVVQESTRTNARGAYRFADLYPGHYDIYAAPPKGQSNDRARAGDRGGRPEGRGKISGLALRSGAHATGYNFVLCAARKK